MAPSKPPSLELLQKLNSEQAAELRRLKSGDGGGTFGGGMDAWQTGVENRLSSLDTRLGGIETRLGSVESKLATIEERVLHLPTKEYFGARLLGMLVLIAALITFGEKLQSLVR